MSTDHLAAEATAPYEASLLKDCRMEIDSLLDCQERGANARILGASASENPYLSGSSMSEDTEERRLMRDAWAFGWTIEDAVRQGGTSLYQFLRAEAALMASGRA